MALHKMTLEITFESETPLAVRSMEHSTATATEPTNTDEFFEELADIDDSAIRHMKLTVTPV